MILVGVPNAVNKILDTYKSMKFIAYNLNSFVVDVPTLQLYPKGSFNPNDPSFDTTYHSMILSNEFSFFEFMKIIIPLERGFNVALYIYDEPTVMNSVTESLLKLIQLRYGYNYQWIQEVDDFNPYDNSDFTVNGVYCLDLDIDRYNEIAMKNNINIVNNQDIILSESHV